MDAAIDLMPSLTKTQNDILQPKRHIFIIECARGFAALYVMLTHIFLFAGIHKTINPEISAIIIFDALMIYDHQAVILFFLLSGFSIHYASLDRPLNTTNGLKYYYFLRFRRIYPIFLFAVLITLGADYFGMLLGIKEHINNIQQLDIGQLLYTLAFLTDQHDMEGIIAPVIHSNGPLWSLSYEVFYYLIYPLFWLVIRKYGAGFSLLIAAALSTAVVILGKIFGANHFFNITSLYLIWCLGAYIADLHRRGIKIRLKPLFHAQLIYILLQSVWVFNNITYTLGAIYDITWGLLFFFIMLLFISQRRIHDMTIAEKVLSAIVAIIGYIVIVIASIKLNFVENKLLFNIRISLTLILFIVGIFFTPFNIKKLIEHILSPLYNFGRISYGIYVIHFPLMLFITGLLSNSGVTVYLSFLFIPLIIYAAYLVEIPFQRRVSTLLTNWAEKNSIIIKREKVLHGPENH